MTPGLYDSADIPMSIYLGDPCPTPSLSASAVTAILRSPAHCHWNHPKLGGHGGDDATVADTGTVAHDLLWGGEGKICVIEADDWRKKEAKEQRDEARANGLTPILAVKYNTVKVMARTAVAFIASSDIKGVMESGQSEMTLIWQEDGLWFRARPDWLNLEAGTMVHYKTSVASVEPNRFGRSIVPAMGYDVAMAFYRRGCLALGLPVDLHVMLAQEQTAPYACSLLSLSQASWAVADAKVERAIAIWRKALATDTWPAYSTRIHDVEPTPWAIAEVEAAMSGEES